MNKIKIISIAIIFILSFLFFCNEIDDTENDNANEEQKFSIVFNSKNDTNTNFSENFKKELSKISFDYQRYIEIIKDINIIYSEKQNNLEELKYQLNEFLKQNKNEIEDLNEQLYALNDKNKFFIHKYFQNNNTIRKFLNISSNLTFEPIINKMFSLIITLNV